MKKAFLILLTSFFLLAPTAQAANLPLLDPNFTIVPSQCTACPCGYAGTLQLIQNLVNLGISIAFVILILIITYAGALFMLSPANPGNREMGKTILVNAFIGLIIVLCSWLLVDFVMKALYNPNVQSEEGAKFGPWNEILGGTGEWCITARPMKSLYNGEELGSGSDISVVSGGGTEGTEGCPTCVPLKDYGVSCTKPDKCTIHPDVAVKLGALKKNYSGNWIVTQAFPSSPGHTNSCHTKGTCVDADFTGGTETTAQNAKAFYVAAQNAGLRPVFEVDETTPCKLRDAAKALGVKNAFCKSDEHYTHIQGTHFSLYGN